MEMINLNKPLFFIVDANNTYQKLISNYLAVFNYTNIKTFSSPKECMGQLALKPDFIIQDYRYEKDEINGVDFLTRVKETLPATEVIFLSGQDNIEVAVKAIKKGATDYIVKNKYALDKLIRRIDKVIRAYKMIQRAEFFKRLLLVVLGVLITCFIILIVLYDRQV